jgi:hypothetical protein
LKPPQDFLRRKKRKETQKADFNFLRLLAFLAAIHVRGGCKPPARRARP